MSRRKVGMSRALGAPYASGPHTLREMVDFASAVPPPELTDPYAAMAAAIYQKSGGPIFVGADFSSGKDETAIAIRHGTRVVLTAASGGTGARIERDWINGLNASRKAEREALAMAFEAIARAHGAVITRKNDPPNPGYCGAGIDMTFSLGGVGGLLDISNLHGGTYALISWHNTEYPSRNFTSRFCVAVGENGNHRPHHKATSCGGDWYSLAMQLDAGLYLAACGQAFDPVTQ